MGSSSRQVSTGRPGLRQFKLTIIHASAEWTAGLDGVADVHGTRVGQDGLQTGERRAVLPGAGADLPGAGLHRPQAGLAGGEGEAAADRQGTTPAGSLSKKM